MAVIMIANGEMDGITSVRGRHASSLSSQSNLIFGPHGKVPCCFIIWLVQSLICGLGPVTLIGQVQRGTSEFVKYREGNLWQPGHPWPFAAYPIFGFNTDSCWHQVRESKWNERQGGWWVAPSRLCLLYRTMRHAKWITQWTLVLPISFPLPNIFHSSTDFGWNKQESN